MGVAGRGGEGVGEGGTERDGSDGAEMRNATEMGREDPSDDHCASE